MRGMLIALPLIVSAMSFAAPECIVDASAAQPDGLLAVITGSVKGFDPGPVYVTVTNGTQEYTTLAARDGKYAVLYANPAANVTVLCFQGWPGPLTQVKATSATK